MQFKKATKAQAKLRLGLVGPSGSGKTYTALQLATHLVPGGRVAVIDTERGSASKYADLFEFDVIEPDTFSPKVYVEAIQAAERAGYDVLVIDSLSHAWMGKDGALELVDAAAKRSRSANSFAAWRDVTPLHNEMIDAILGARLHVIATLRAKTEYVIEEDARGKKVPRKVGMQPVQRDGLEYEFDVVGDMDHDNNFIVGKTRCTALAGAAIHKPGADLAATLRAWLTDGEPAPAAPEEEPANEDQLNEVAELMHHEAITDTERASIKKHLDAGVTADWAAKALDRLNRLIADRADAQEAEASANPTQTRRSTRSSSGSSANASADSNGGLSGEAAA